MPETGLRTAAVALAPATVLRLLADAAAAAESEPPALSVYLAGGQVLSGLLVRVGEDRGSDVLVLVDQTASRLGYALLANVVAVEVHNPGPFQDMLTAGTLPLPPPGEPVTRLQLQREFAPADDFPVHVDWAALEGSDAVLGNLAMVLRGLREAVAQVRADEMGRRAWEQVRVLQVEHQDGAELVLRRIPGGLTVRADLSAALPRALGGELYRKLCALL